MAVSIPHIHQETENDKHGREHNQDCSRFYSKGHYIGRALVSVVEDRCIYRLSSGIFRG